MPGSFENVGYDARLQYTTLVVDLMRYCDQMVIAKDLEHFFLALGVLRVHSQPFMKLDKAQCDSMEKDFLEISDLLYDKTFLGHHHKHQNHISMPVSEVVNYKKKFGILFVKMNNLYLTLNDGMKPMLLPTYRKEDPGRAAFKV